VFHFTSFKVVLMQGDNELPVCTVVMDNRWKYMASGRAGSWRTNSPRRGQMRSRK